jgi:hypothetical protein
VISGQSGRRRLIRPQYSNKITINISEQSNTSMIAFIAINTLMKDRRLNGHDRIEDDEEKWWEISKSPRFRFKL